MSEGTITSAPSGRHHLGVDRQLGFGVLTVSDLYTEDDDPAGALARQLIESAGHRVVRRALVGSSLADVRERMEPWLVDPTVEIVVTIGGTGASSRDLTVSALEAMGGRKLDGFGEIYRALSFQEVGALAMLSRAGLYVLQGRPVFAIPESDRAVKMALERLILPAAVHLVEELER